MFVWKDHLLLITCGQTKLIEAVLYFLEQIEEKYILQLLFQRKNEYFSDRQYSDFDADVQRLQKTLDGEIVIFGDVDGHFTKLFYLKKEYLLEEQTNELLMHDISREAVQFLLKPDHSKEELREFFQLSEMIPNFEIDDFTFEPCGYSLNAINEKQYLTIHVTPQPEHSYVSLETNIPLQEILEFPLSTLKPRYFDVLIYQLDDEESLRDKIPLAYQKIHHQRERLDCGSTVHFCHSSMDEK